MSNKKVFEKNLWKLCEKTKSSTAYFYEPNAHHTHIIPKTINARKRKNPKTLPAAIAAISRVVSAVPADVRIRRSSNVVLEFLVSSELLNILVIIGLSCAIEDFPVILNDSIDGIASDGRPSTIFHIINTETQQDCSQNSSPHCHSFIFSV